MLSVPRLAALVACAASLLLLPTAAHAEPAPFGHACSPLEGVRFCPTADLAGRVPSFDGTLLDVDVTLPAAGDGPFPTILLLHGLGGTKTSFEGTRGDLKYNNIFFAQHGYAVVTPTARGFGDSCGPALAGTAGCEQGWTRLGDMRYEVRDVQTLVGRLVDEGVVRPNAIAATGISYGGGFSTMLAFLKDRVRLPDGGYAPWTSPAGTPISLTAAWPRWMWSNGESIFTRNGRGPWSRTPTGVEAKTYADLIFGVTASGNVAPAGGDLSTDIKLWKTQLDRGVFDASTRPTLENTYNFHGVAGVPRTAGGPAALLIQEGWTDALFPVGQALGAYDAVRHADKKAPVALQLGDLGHGPAANHPEQVAATDDEGLQFLDAWLRTGSKPAPGSVTAYLMTCPATAKSPIGAFKAATFHALAHGRFTLTSDRTLKIDQRGGSAKLAQNVSSVATGAQCTTYAPDPKSKATIIATAPRMTLIGQPTITGRVVTKGRYGQLDARVWDRDLRTGKQRLVTRGAYRLDTNQKGNFVFTLDGNGYRFGKGHRVVVELLGRDAPTYGPSPNAFSAKLTHVKVHLPVVEPPSSSPKKITAP
jgi:pimeloyl-ACP methyl ester carboxylesterase